MPTPSTAWIFGQLTAWWTTAVLPARHSLSSSYHLQVAPGDPATTPWTVQRPAASPPYQWRRPQALSASAYNATTRLRNRCCQRAPSMQLDGDRSQRLNSRLPKVSGCNSYENKSNWLMEVRCDTLSRRKQDYTLIFFRFHFNSSRRKKNKYTRYFSHHSQSLDYVTVIWLSSLWFSVTTGRNN